uniref:Glutamine cyclotransferase n=1 Tax=Chaetoceros debilis TaxID=122233 RepID=A0A7S3V5H2_9STRA
MARKRNLRRRKRTVDAPSLEKDNVKMERNTSSQRNFITVIVLAIAMMLGVVFRQGNSSHEHATTSDFNSPAGDEINEDFSAQVMTYEDFELLDSFEHDDKAFTQGLTYFDGHVYEGTGMHGSSSIKKLGTDFSSTVLSNDLKEEYFGEGITYYKTPGGKDRFIQLTWREKTAFVYDAETLSLLRSFQYDNFTGEGWGITWDENNSEFIISDGSDFLYIYDTENFEEKRRFKVSAYTDHGSSPIPVTLLNELEFVPSQIDATNDFVLNDRPSSTVLANVWHENFIIEIDLASGVVLRLYDISSLCPQVTGENVLNGISVTGDQDSRMFYITGKLWKKLHKVRLKVT